MTHRSTTHPVRPRMLAVLTAVLVALGLQTTPPAHAAQLYVDCDGGDDLGAALRAATDDDVVVVMGTCVGSHTITDKRISLLGLLHATLVASDHGRDPLTVRNSVLTLEDVTLTGGNVGLNVLGNSHVAATDVRVHDNDGGVVVDGTSSATLTDSAVTSNDTRYPDQQPIERGGIDSAGLVVLRRVVVEGNAADDAGFGAGVRSTGTLLVSDSTFVGNRGGRGGVAVHSTGSATIVRTTFSGNRGMPVVNGGELQLRRSAIVENDGRGDETAGILNSGTLHVSESTIAGNVGGDGGALLNRGTATLEAVTIAHNSPEPRFPIVEEATVVNEGELTMTSTVVGASDGPDCELVRPIISGGHNVVAPTCTFDAVAATDVVTDDVRLAPPADNGGPVPTVRPLDRSPVVDAGSCVTGADPRGVSRPQGAACDAGAYENRPPDAVAATSIDERPYTQGGVTLTWSPARDADGDTVRYLVERRDDDDATWTTVDRTVESSVRVDGHDEGTWRYRVTTDDGNTTAVPSPTARIVVDRTAPGTPTFTTDRPADHVDPDGGWWFSDTLEVTVVPGEDPDLPDGSRGSGVPTLALPGLPGGDLLAERHTFSDEGVHRLTSTTTDRAGNASAPVTGTFHVDRTPPSLTLDGCPDRVLLGAVATVAWQAADTGVGLAGPTAGSRSIDTGAVGATTTTVTSLDLVGNATTVGCTTHVVYDYSGFDAPLKAEPPATTTLTAGRDVPVRFSLAGDQGMQVLDGLPTVTPVDCATLDPAGPPADAHEAKAFDYDGRKDTYTFWWATDRSQRDSCVLLTLRLDDGTTHGAVAAFR